MSSNNNPSEVDADEIRNQQIKSIEAYNRDEEDRSIDITFYEIYPIQIMVQSNVPNKPEFVLKSSMFNVEPRPSYAKKFNEPYAEMPYFTNEYEYPYSYLVKLQQYEIMDFFFIREEFELKLKKYLFKMLGKDGIKQGASELKKEENSKKNVMYMLLLLIKTVYPKENNINTSFTELLDQYSSGINFNSVLSMTPTYTYLKESGTEYTVLRVLFLNDIFNNNVYSKLFDAFYEYYVWCGKQAKKVANEEKVNKAKIERLIRDYKKLDNDLGVIESAQQQLEGANSGFKRFDIIEYQYNLTALSNIFQLIKLYKQYTSTSSGRDEIQREMNELASNKMDIPVTEIKITNMDEAYKLKENSSIIEFKDSEGYLYRGKIKSVDEKKKEILFEIHNLTTSLGITIKIDINSQPVFITSGLYSNKIDNIKTSSKDNKISLLNTLEIKEIITGKGTASYHYPYKSGGNASKPQYLLTDAEFDQICKPPNNCNSMKFTSSKPMYLAQSEFKNDVNRFINKLKTAFIKMREKPKDATPLDVDNDLSPNEIIFDALDKIESLFKFVSNKIQFNRETSGFVKNLVQPYTTYKESKLLSDLYFKYKKVDINFPMEKYDGYMNFINVLKLYLNPTRESTNRTLQELIMDYANNRTGSDKVYPQFVTVANSLYKCFDKFNPRCTIIKDKSRREIVKPFIDTGVSEININVLNQHKYEINIHLDLVEGRLTPENTSSINCLYQDTSLADRFEILVGRKQKGDWLIAPAPFTKVKATAKESGEPTRFQKIRDTISSVFRPTVTAKKGGRMRDHRRTRRKKNRNMRSLVWLYFTITNIVTFVGVYVDYFL